jgi:uncharacterized protein (DUF39 family)/CBS domain-containing protein
MLLSKRGAEELRTYEEINQKIKSGDAIVMTADDFIKTIEDSGLERATKEVDVVTTGTFGAMCSSGAFINFGHSEPPIKMSKCWLNDVPAYKGLAAVDCYLGAAAMSETKGFDYGGGHVIEDLVSGKEIELRAEAYGTDCYPRRSIETTVTIDDLNQTVLLNPRNAYERYNAATNGTDRIIHTYMGTLLPHYGNVTYSGAGQLSPLYKDRNFETIGIGTRIFLGGGIGYVIGEGTQHSPQNQFGTIMVRGDLKQMNNRYLKGATYYKYGTTLYVGIGIPIPIINRRVAASAALKDEEIFTEILDYGVPSRSRPRVKRTSYSELKSGRVEINGREITSSSLSSNKVAKEIATNLKRWIEEGAFFLNRPVELVPDHTEFKPLELRRKEPRVKDIMTKELVVGNPTDDIKSVARILIAKGVDHLPIADGEGKLIGIITSWDLAKAVAQDKRQLHEIMTIKVITAKEDEAIDTVVRRMEQHNISGVPVVDHSNRILGMLTVNDISKKLIRRP